MTTQSESDMADQQSETRKALWIVLGVLAVVAVIPVLLALGGAAVYFMARSRVAAQKPSGLPEEYDYAIEKLQIVDPSQIGYEEAATIEVTLTTPRGLAVGRDDRVYVAGDQKLVVFGSDGARLSEAALGGAPRALTAAADGTLYVAMRDHIEVCSPAGERQARWEGLGAKALLTSVAVAEKDVFAADAGNRVVVRYDTAGKLLGRIGRKDPKRNIPGILVPSPYFDVAVGHEGLLWVANPGRRRIELYTFDGDLEVWWGKAGIALERFSGCCNPSHFALLPDRGVVTSEKGLVRVKVHDGDGTFRTVVGAAPDAFDEGAVGLDVATDSKGRILVLDPGARRVRIFTRKASDERDGF